MFLRLPSEPLPRRVQIPVRALGIPKVVIVRRADDKQ